jgi:hypothetical protein
MSKPSRVVQDIIEQVSWSLAPEGFRRQGTRLTRSDENVAVIDFQRSIHSSKDAVLLTVNVGGVSRRICRFDGVLSGKAPSPTKWHWRERLGNMADHPSDTWWTITSETNEQAVAQDIAARLREDASDSVKTVLTDNSLRDAWLSGRSPGLTKGQRLRLLAILLRYIGPEDLLPQILEEFAALAPGHAATMSRELYGIDRTSGRRVGE